MSGVKAAFLDRDGVLNLDHGYVHRLQDVTLVQGAAEAVGRLTRAGYLVVIVTNQSGIGRGYYDEAAMHSVHDHLKLQIGPAGGRIDAIYFCPYHPDAVTEALRHPDHPDRKPNPGLILRAIEDFGIDRTASFLIGDKASDIQAAERAGIEGHLFTGGDLDRFVAAILGRREGQA